MVQGPGVTSDYAHLDPQVPGEQPGVGVVLLLLELDLRSRGQSRLFKLLHRRLSSPIRPALWRPGSSAARA